LVFIFFRFLLFFERFKETIFQNRLNEQIAYQYLLKIFYLPKSANIGLKMPVFRNFARQSDSFLDIAKQAIYHLKFRLLLPGLAVCSDNESKQDTAAK